MKNSFLRDALKWGAALACLNFVMALLLPMSNSLDPQAILILSPLTGFVGGIVIHILKFLASEAVMYSEYRLTKVEGSTWNNQNALLRVASMTLCGLLGGGIALWGIAMIAIDHYSDEELLIVPFAPLFLVVGFGFGVFAYFFLWVLGLILSYLSPRTKTLRGEAFREAGKLTATLKQLYQNWKSHDYRS